MEMNTIIGIVIAVVIMLVGLSMILRKPKADTMDATERQLEALRQQNETPRPVPTALVTDGKLIAPERVEPSFKAEAIVVEPPVLAATAEFEREDVAEAEIAQEAATAMGQQAELELIVDAPVQLDAAKAELSLNPNIETVAIAEFEGESNILDVHLHEQQRHDDESVLATAEQIIALNVYPNPRRALSGDKALKVLLKYGLRFGEMSCFHRYENTEEPSALMFSVLRITDNGPAGFDLETLATEKVQGLAFFLALPNSKAVTGYDMMTSIAGLIAREIDGKVYDEDNLEFTPQLKEHWRHHVIDYRPNQAAT